MLLLRDFLLLLRGSYDDELDLDASMDAGSELLTPSSLLRRPGRF